MVIDRSFAYEESGTPNIKPIQRVRYTFFGSGKGTRRQFENGESGRFEER